MPAPCRLGLFSDTLSVCFRAVCHGGRGSGGNGRGPPPRSTWLRRAAEEAPRGCARPPVRRPKSRGLGPRQRRAPSRQRPPRRAPPPASRRVLAHRARVPALQTTAHRGGGAPHPHARASTTCRGPGGASLPTSRPGRRLSRDGGGGGRCCGVAGRGSLHRTATRRSHDDPQGAGVTTTFKEPACGGGRRARRGGIMLPDSWLAAPPAATPGAEPCPPRRGGGGGHPAARCALDRESRLRVPHPPSLRCHPRFGASPPGLPAASSPPLPPPRFGYPLATVMHASRPEASS